MHLILTDLWNEILAIIFIIEELLARSWKNFVKFIMITNSIISYRGANY